MARVAPLDPAAGTLPGRRGVTNRERKLAHAPVATDAHERRYDPRGEAWLRHHVASKGGPIGLTMSWAIGSAPHDDRVVVIHPAVVNTPVNDGLAAPEGRTPLQVAERPAGDLRAVAWVEPSDVAGAVVSLAPNLATSVTGSQFVLDGGLSTR